MVIVRRVRANEAEELRAIRLAALEADPTAFGRTHAEQVAYDTQHWRMRAAGSDTSQTFVAVARLASRLRADIISEMATGRQDR